VSKAQSTQAGLSHLRVDDAECFCEFFAVEFFANNRVALLSPMTATFFYGNVIATGQVGTRCGN
jgi:hypothetical protein